MGELPLERYAKRMKELQTMVDAKETQKRNIRAGMGEQTLILDDPQAVLTYTAEIANFLKDQEIERCKPWLRGWAGGRHNPVRQEGFSLCPAAHPVIGRHWDLVLKSGFPGFHPDTLDELPPTRG